MVGAPVLVLELKTTSRVVPVEMSSPQTTIAASRAPVVVEVVEDVVPADGAVVVGAVVVGAVGVVAGEVVVALGVVPGVSCAWRTDVFGEMLPVVFV